MHQVQNHCTGFALSPWLYALAYLHVCELCCSVSAVLLCPHRRAVVPHASTSALAFLICRHLSQMVSSVTCWWSIYILQVLPDLFISPWLGWDSLWVSFLKGCCNNSWMNEWIKRPDIFSSDNGLAEHLKQRTAHFLLWPKTSDQTQFITVCIITRLYEISQMLIRKGLYRR